MRKNISIMLVIIWMSVIFCFSSMPGNESNYKSKSTLNGIVKITVETTNDIGITNKNPSENKKKEVVEKFNYLFRKVIHANEYFILAILLFFALKNSGVVGKKAFILVLSISFLYSCSDEFHQRFVEGRTGQFSDVLIDTLGTIIGVLLISFIYKIKKVFCKFKINNPTVFL